MKVEQAETKVFKPITITIETREELDAIYDLIIVPRDISLEKELRMNEDRICRADDIGYDLFSELDEIKQRIIDENRG